MWHNPQLWNTADGVVPYRVFVMLCSELQHDAAERRLAVGQGVAFGIATAFGDGKDLKLKRFSRQLTKLAHPEVAVGEP